MRSGLYGLGMISHRSKEVSKMIKIENEDVLRLSPGRAILGFKFDVLKEERLLNYCFGTIEGNRWRVYAILRMHVFKAK